MKKKKEQQEEQFMITFTCCDLNEYTSHFVFTYN